MKLIENYYTHTPRPKIILTIDMLPVQFTFLHLKWFSYALWPSPVKTYNLIPEWV